MSRYLNENNPYLAKDKKGYLIHLDNDWWPKHLGRKEGYLAAEKEHALTDEEDSCIRDILYYIIYDDIGYAGDLSALASIKKKVLGE